MALELVSDNPDPDDVPGEEDGWTLDAAKNAYLDYLNVKIKEINERKTSLKYYHTNQITDTQRKALGERKMAEIQKNRINKKIDGMVGTLARLKQDPKAYPRTPEHEEGAELATQTVNFELDEADWDTLQSDVARWAAITGLGVAEKLLEESDIVEGDYDPDIKAVDPSDYFYDPRTFTLDFSDCSYDGVGKWFTIEQADRMFPGKEEELRIGISSGSDLTSQPAKDQKWFINGARGDLEKLRIVEIWYQWGDGWRWIIFTGANIIDEGESYFYDGKGKQTSKYVKFAAYRDEEGDIYSFIRTMRFPQDMINAQSMGILYDQKTRRIIVRGEDPQNLEKIRKEWSRPDGTIILPPGAEVTTDNKTADIQFALESLAENKAEIDGYGLNANVFGDSNNPDLSGRAISLIQQAGLAELGPFLVQYKKWKLTVYRHTWANIQRYWTGERFIRVTDDKDVLEFIGINQLEFDPNQQAFVITRNVGELDVDIIMDEGPDVMNAMQDAYQSMLEAQQNGAQIPPQLLIELSPLPSEVKERILKQMEEAGQPDPMQQQAVMLELQKMQAEIQKLQSEAAKNMSTAGTTAPSQLDNVQQVADIKKTYAETDKTLSEANGPTGEREPSLLELAQQAANIENTRAKTVNELSNAINNGRDDRGPLDEFEQFSKIRKTNAETARILNPAPTQQV